MAVPDADRLVITSWTGVYEPADEAYVVSDLYDDLGDGHLVALHVLRFRLNEILLGPGRAEVDGDYEEDWEATIRAKERQIARLENVIDGLDLDYDGSGKSRLTMSTMVKGGIRERTYVKPDGTRVR